MPDKKTPTPSTEVKDSGEKRAEDNPKLSTSLQDDIAARVGRTVAPAQQIPFPSTEKNAAAVMFPPRVEPVTPDAGRIDDGSLSGPPKRRAKDPSIFVDPAIASHILLPVMHPNYVLKPVAVALAGGGSMGDFELGALDFIYKEFLGSDHATALGFSRSRFDIATGASVGAVNAAAISQGASESIDELKDTWFRLKDNGDFYHLNDEIQRIIGSTGEPAIARILKDALLGFAMTGLIPFGFLFFGAVGADIKRLYEVLAALPSIMNPEPLANLCRSFEGYWSPAGPGLRGAAISVTRDLHGHRVVFARGYDDMLYVRWQLDVNPISTSTPWTSWRALGGPISSDPVGYYTGFVTGPRDNPTRVSVIARLANQKEYGGRTVDFMDDVTHLDSRPNYNPFLEWQSVPAPPDPIPEMYFSQPTVIQRAPDGRAWAFCHDGGHNSTTPSSTYFSVWTGDSWLPWRPFGTSGDSSWHDRLFGTSKSGSQRIAGNITGCSYGVGTLELFARSADFLMLHNYTANGDAPGDWNSFNGWATSDIHVILNEDPEYVIDVFWRGTDGQVWTRRKVGSRSAWEGQRPLGGMITSNICSARNANNTWVIFARGLDNNLYELRQTEVNGIWPVNAWRLIGAPPNLTILADPYSPAATPTSGLLLERPEIYVVASDHSVWMIRQRPDETYSQSDWVSLGGKVWTGMKLRVSTVALETGEARYLDEVGRFVDQAERFAADSQGNIEPIASNNGDIRFARADGVIASCAAPGFFPAIPLNGKTWVDGGMRHSVPVGAAIKAGASRVVAIATVPTGLDAVPRILPPASREPPASLEEEIKISIGQDDSLGLITTYSSASMIDVLVRSFAELLIDSTSWNELYPETPWPVPVWVIQQTFKIHEGQTIEPGLIRMNYACGWMRAFDVLIATEDVRQAAIESTDRIIRLRWQSWKTEARFREAYLIATSPYTRRTSTALTPELARLREAAHLAQRWLGESRLLKWDLRVALLARRDAGFLLPPDANIWLARFERFAPQAHWGLGWENRIRFSEFLFEEIQITVAGNYEPGPFGRSEHSVGAAVPPMLDG